MEYWLHKDEQLYSMGRNRQGRISMTIRSLLKKINQHEQHPRKDNFDKITVEHKPCKLFCTLKCNSVEGEWNTTTMSIISKTIRFHSSFLEWAMNERHTKTNAFSLIAGQVMTNRLAPQLKICILHLNISPRDNDYI